MAIKSFKLRGQGVGGGESFEGSTVDWEKINDQVDTGPQPARISQLWDLGLHVDEVKLATGDGNETSFEEEEEAEAFLEEMKEKHGAGHKAFKEGQDKAEIFEEDGKWVVTCKEYGGQKSYQEIALVADFTEMPVDYGIIDGEDVGEKPFRMYINGNWKGNLKGFQMKPSKPKKDGGVWTFASNSLIFKLISAIGRKDLLQVDLKEMDISEIVGQALNINIEKSEDGKYVNHSGFSGLRMKKGVVVQEVEELENEPMIITFDTVTLDDLIAAMPRGSLIKKIKLATDYKGSNMQTAIEQYEEYLKQKRKEAKATENTEALDVDEDDADLDDDDTENSKVTRVKNTRKNTKVTEDKKESVGYDRVRNKRQSSGKVEKKVDEGVDDVDDWDMGNG